jgi:hypothetical protein
MNLQRKHGFTDEIEELADEFATTLGSNYLITFPFGEVGYLQDRGERSIHANLMTSLLVFTTMPRVKEEHGQDAGREKSLLRGLLDEFKKINEAFDTGEEEKNMYPCADGSYSRNLGDCVNGLSRNPGEPNHANHTRRDSIGHVQEKDNGGQLSKFFEMLGDLNDERTLQSDQVLACIDTLSTAHLKHALLSNVFMTRRCLEAATCCWDLAEEKPSRRMEFEDIAKDVGALPTAIITVLSELYGEVRTQQLLLVDAKLWNICSVKSVEHKQFVALAIVQNILDKMWSHQRTWAEPSDDDDEPKEDAFGAQLVKRGIITPSMLTPRARFWYVDFVSSVALIALLFSVVYSGVDPTRAVVACACVIENFVIEVRTNEAQNCVALALI